MYNCLHAPADANALSKANIAVIWSAWKLEIWFKVHLNPKPSLHGSSISQALGISQTTRADMAVPGVHEVGSPKRVESFIGHHSPQPMQQIAQQAPDTIGATGA